MARLVLHPQGQRFTLRALRIKTAGKASLLKSALIILLAFLSVVSTASFAKTIVVLGDSISAAYNMPEEKGWVNLLQQTLQANGYPHTVVNTSISGDTTAGA